MPSWKKVLISGSDAALNSLNITTALTASGLIYPISDGTSGQSLVTDGSGNLSFTTISGGTAETGSLLVTASISGNVLTFEKGDSTTFNIQLPSSTGGGGDGVSATAHLTQSVAAVTWSFNHSLNDRLPVITVFDSNHDVIIPNRIHTIDQDNLNIHFSTARTGYATAIVMGATASYAFNSVTASYVEYSNIANKPTLLSGSAQIASDISGSLTSFSSSIVNRVEALESFSSSLNATFATDSELAAVSGAIAGDIADIIDGTTVVASASHAEYAESSSFATYFNISQALTASGLLYPTVDGTVGQVVTTDGAGNLSFLNVDNTRITIKNVSGAEIPKGTPLFITGSGTNGNIAGVIPADAGNPDLMPAGVIAGETLADEAEGVGLINGFIDGVDTSLFAPGDEVFVAVGGGYTNVAPTGSALIQKLGNVEKSHPSAGSGVINGPGAVRSVPNILPGYSWVGNSDYVATAVPTASFFVTSGSHALNADDAISASYAANADLLDGLNSSQFLRNDQSGTLTGDLTVTGIITAQEFHTEFVSASIIYQSGSTQFGNSADDTHIFSGSVNIDGAVIADSFTGIFVGALSSSAQIASDISGSFISLSSSLEQRISPLEVSVSSLNSATSSYALTSNISGAFASTSSSLSGRIAAQEQFSSSLSTTVLVLSGSFSGSFVGDGSQLSGVTSYTDADTLEYINSIGVLSGSAQIDSDISGAFALTSSSLAVRIAAQESFSSSLNATFATDAELSAVSGALAASISSISTDFADITNKPTLISSSLQFNTLTTPFTGSFTGSFFGDGSNLSGVTSYTDADTLEYINSLGVVSGSAQVNTGSFTGSFFGDGTGLTGLGYGDTKKLNQTVAATTWSFSHNMNEQYPTVTVYNSSNEVIQPSKIEGVDAQTLRLYFGVPTAGTAVAVVGGVALTQEAGFNRVFTQASTATTWSFEHNLGNKYPQIAVYDSNDELIIPGKVEAIDQNNAILYFDTAQSGVATATVGGTSLTASYANTLVVTDTLLSSQTNTDIDTGTETVATVSTTYYDGAFFDYVAKDGTNFRAGTVMAVWDGTSVQFNDNSTSDIGDTSGVTLSVDISGTDARLRAAVTTDNWTIKAFVRAL